MDLFDPSSAREIACRFVEAAGEQRWPLLKRIPFLALSDNATSSLVQAGIIPKLISLVEEPDGNREMQAIAHTCLRLLIKFTEEPLELNGVVLATLTTQLVSSTPRQQVELLAVLAASNLVTSPDVPSQWETISRVLLDVESSERDLEQNNLRQLSRCLASFTRSEAFCQYFDERYTVALPKLFKACPLDALKSISSLSANRAFDHIITDLVPQITHFCRSDDPKVRVAALDTVAKLSEQVIFHKSIEDRPPDILRSFDTRNNSDAVQISAMTTVTKLAMHIIPCDFMKVCIDPVIQKLFSFEDEIRHAAVATLDTLFLHVEYHAHIQQALATRNGYTGAEKVLVTMASTIGKLTAHGKTLIECDPWSD
ncbi:armadillo-type protein [Mycena albidolilacea]|uniref:Armadillo-type protein n=1 Tax=Mycena albidolilacea TaxID=1033008 RepID=A0AAD6YXR5_9AGAR|nr:armadillo-type protein [Mycena albidolilacea]